MPTAVSPGPILLVTTAPAPITALSPIVTPLRMVTPAPIQTLFPIQTAFPIPLRPSDHETITSNGAPVLKSNVLDLLPAHASQLSQNSNPSQLAFQHLCEHKMPKARKMYIVWRLETSQALAAQL